jgi:hypothetical protein
VITLWTYPSFLRLLEERPRPSIKATRRREIMTSRRPKQPEHPQPKSPDDTQPLPQWLIEDAETLQEIIQWWKNRESAAMEASDRRPAFLGKTRNTGIRVSAEILDRAITKAKEERLKTGGNLSQLVEWLLWIYLGRPGDVVDR